MVKLLKDSDLDPENEAVDLAMAKAEEEAAARQFAPTRTPGDLSDGGMVNGVRLAPMVNGKKVAEGRPAARRAWMWNGTETVLPLAYDPSGKSHDAARRYLLKRHCLCCNQGGFRGAQCPNCVKNNCDRCRGSSDRKKVISNFYLSRADVPFPLRFYGEFDCFLSMCPRREDRGFKTEEEMRMHARSRHKLEYQAYTETMAAKRVDQVDVLQRRVDELMAALAKVVPQPAQDQSERINKMEREMELQRQERHAAETNENAAREKRNAANRERMAHARAARKPTRQVEPVDAGVVLSVPV